MTISKPNSIVVPVDFSTASIEAVGIALEMAQSADQVHVLYVVPDMRTEADYVREAFSKSDSQAKARKELEAKLQEHDYAGVDVQIEEGEPSETIAVVAARHKADLIVMPSHSRKGLPRLFLGSVANQVLRMAECPVLILKHAK